MPEHRHEVFVAGSYPEHLLRRDITGSDTQRGGGDFPLDYQHRVGKELNRGRGKGVSAGRRGGKALLLGGAGTFSPRERQDGHADTLPRNDDCFATPLSLSPT